MSINDDFVSACKRENIEEIEKLLEDGADINSRDREGRTPLVYYSEYVNFDMIRYLIEKGADVNLYDENEYYSPLMWLAEKDIAIMVDLLIKSGADVKYANNNDETALSLAKKGGHDDVVALLKKAGA